MAESPQYFEDPEAAVERINELLAAEDWETLARYYDFGGTELSFDEVARWEWFEHGGAPVADPTGRSGPHHPFPRGGTYRDHEVDGGVCRVTVELDPGLVELYESPETVRFDLVRREHGWRLRPPDDDTLSR